MKKILLLAIFVTLSFAQWGCQKKVQLKTDDDKTFYAVGQMFGSRLSQLDLSDQEIDAMNQGLRDAAKGQKSEIDVSQYQRKIQELFKNRMEKNAEKVKQEGTAYLEKFLKEEGVKKTESGLAYKMLKEGVGPLPIATDKVQVHYHGTLINGEVFDSSVDRKKEVTFPLNRVIKGWTEGLQLLKEGGKIRLVIPPDLAYGDRGAPPKIPGGATLVFDVELIKVNPPAEEPDAKKAVEAKQEQVKKDEKAEKNQDKKKDKQST